MGLASDEFDSFYPEQNSDDGADAFPVRIQSVADPPPLPPEFDVLYRGMPYWQVAAFESHRLFRVVPPFVRHRRAVLRIDLDAADGMAAAVPAVSPGAADATAHVLNPISHPLDRVLMMYLLSLRGGLLMHAAGLVMSGRGIVCAGRSGAGKTTLSRLFLETCGAGGLLCDDRIVVRPDDDGRHRVHGTPWPGDIRLARNESAPLQAVLLLEQATEDRLVRLDPNQATRRLLPTLSIPWFDESVMEHALSACRTLLDRVPVYALRFRPTPHVIDLIASIA